jgi:L-malate glycosyltransferase
MKIVFVWENFGPIHLDRCEAVALNLADIAEVEGIELFGSSSTYSWIAGSRSTFKKTTVFSGDQVSGVGVRRRFLETVRTCIKSRATHFFLCHYESTATLFTAIALRLLGKRVFVMGDSKFDDYERILWRECLKALFYLPYHGALGSGIRCLEYYKFLGISPKKTVGNYNTLNVARLKSVAEDFPLEPPDTRPFVIVARLVPKKNLFVALRAYAAYRRSVTSPRLLEIAGNGPLEQDLLRESERLGVADWVVWRGFIQEHDVLELIARAQALLLLSTEEQFGNVVLEAVSLKIPVIVSNNVGARDKLVRSGVNGFVVEPNNVDGIAFFMRLLGHDSELRSSMSEAQESFAALADVANFCASVRTLCGVAASEEQGVAP